MLERFATEMSAAIEVSVFVRTGELTDVPGASVAPLPDSAAGLPEADVVLVDADIPGAAALDLTGGAHGTPYLLLHGIAENDPATVEANIAAVPDVLVASEWLAGWASGRGARTIPVRYGLDRDLFFAGPPADERPLMVAMPVAHAESRGTTEGFEAIARVLADVPRCQVVAFGEEDPHFGRASFVENPSREQLAVLLRTATVVLDPAWEPDFGLLGIQAMACGAAYAAVHADGTAEYAIHRRNALLAPARDAEGLADNVLSLLLDPELTQRVTGGGHETAAEFGDWPAAAELLTSILARGSGSSVTT